MQIQVNKDNDVTSDGYDDRFQMNVKKITQDLDNYGFQLCHESVDNGKLTEYKRKCDCLKERLKESIVLINAFCDEDDKERKENILQFARNSCDMIKENNDEFYMHQERWKVMNDMMKSSNEILETLLNSRGLKRKKMVSNSLYILLEAERVEELDNFWEEYQDGRLRKEFQRILFIGGSSDLSIVITEHNYRQYRKYLRKFSFYVP